MALYRLNTLSLFSSVLSAFSIEDQLTLDPRYGASQTDVENFLSKIRSESSILSMTDLVFNHTANSSKWLNDCPEATFNLGLDFQF